MYIDAIVDRQQDKIFVVERNNNERVFKEYACDYSFYINDPAGKFRSIYNTPLTKIQCKTYKDFQKEIRINSDKKLWESDLNPINNCLSKNYRHIPPPAMHVAFFDIETGFDEERGLSPVTDPFNPVTAISIYLQWMEKMVTLALVPSTLEFSKAREIANEFTDTFIFKNETELLNTFLDLIEDVDILSGWNSEGYDIPYLVNRTQLILSKNDLRRFSLWDQMPKKRLYIKYGIENTTYDLTGRIHIDYMALYRKYTYEERQSFSLDAISEFEIHEHKVPYEGTLDQLYNNDFLKFIEYNRQDVQLINKLDKKLQFLDLANNVAHDSTILLPAVLGTVAMVEQSVINEAHDLDLIVPNKIKFHAEIDEDGEEKEDTAAGAYVANPKKGIHKWVGITDINSLYPNTIRSLNMCLETIVGQVLPTLTDKYINEKLEIDPSISHAWEGLFGTLEYSAILDQKRDIEVEINWEGVNQITKMSAAEAFQLIFLSGKKWMLSGNGTIFTYEKEGIIPGLFKRWYEERKEFQKKFKLSEEIAAGIEIPNNLLEQLNNVI